MLDHDVMRLRPAPDPTPCWDRHSCEQLSYHRVIRDRFQEVGKKKRSCIPYSLSYTMGYLLDKTENLLHIIGAGHVTT
jgi:hypothetical protein